MPLATEDRGGIERLVPTSFLVEAVSPVRSGEFDQPLRCHRDADPVGVSVDNGGHEDRSVADVECVST